MIELRWLEREQIIGGDCHNGGEVVPIKVKKLILQQRTKNESGMFGFDAFAQWSDWMDVPVVKEDDI